MVDTPAEAAEILQNIDQQLGSNEQTDLLAMKYSTGLVNESPERAVTELANALQIDGEKANEIATSVYASYWNHTAQAIEQASGLDGQEVLETISKVLTRQERASLMNRIYLGDRSVIQELISKY